MGRIGQKIKRGLRAGLTTAGIVGGLYLGYKNAFDDKQISPVDRVSNVVEDAEGVKLLAEQKAKQVQEEAEKLKNASKLDKAKAGAQVVGNQAVQRAGALEREKAQRVGDMVANRQTAQGKNQAGALDQATNEATQKKLVAESIERNKTLKKQGIADCERQFGGRSKSAQAKYRKCIKANNKKYPN